MYGSVPSETTPLVDEGAQERKPRSLLARATMSAAAVSAVLLVGAGVAGGVSGARNAAQGTAFTETASSHAAASPLSWFSGFKSNAYSTENDASEPAGTEDDVVGAYVHPSATTEAEAPRPFGIFPAKPQLELRSLGDFQEVAEYKLVITQVRGNIDDECNVNTPNCLLSMNEMKFYTAAGEVAAGDVDVTIAAGAESNTRPRETAANLFDGESGTKFLDLGFNDNHETTLSITFPNPIALTGFDYMTSKYAMRDPVTWEFMAVSEADDEVVLTTNEAEIGMQRFAWAGPFMFPIPPSPPPEDEPVEVVRQGDISTDYPEAQLLSSGWTKVLDVPYSHGSVSADIAQCAGYDFIAIGCKSSPNNPMLSVVAMEEYDFIASVPRSTNTAYKNPSSPSGAYWTVYPGKSIGFAPNELVQLSSADVASRSDPMRLSWHYDNGGHGGWRCGATTSLNSNTQWHKLVYCANSAVMPPAPPSPAEPPTPELAVSSGIELDYPEFEMAGWTKVLDVPYSHASVSADVNLCSGYDYIAVGCKSSPQASVISLIAMEEYSFVSSGVPLSTNTAYKNPANANGAYWTVYPSKSIGFAPNSAVSLHSADTTDRADPNRLSWHYDNGGHGGWRCGATTSLNSNTQWHKLIYCASGNQVPVPPPVVAPSALHTNYAESNFASWTKVLDVPYSHASVSADVSQCAGYTNIAVGCKPVGSTSLSVVAIDTYAWITSVPLSTNTAYKNPANANGAYWTVYPSKSIGFAPNSAVSLHSADTTDRADPNRLSWHYDNGGHGGWRCGATTNLNSNTQWHKIIYCS